MVRGVVFYCTAPKVWPPVKPVAELSPDQVAGDVCWSEWESPEARLAHMKEAHVEWCRSLGVIRR